MISMKAFASLSPALSEARYRVPSGFLPAVLTLHTILVMRLVENRVQLLVALASLTFLTNQAVHLPLNYSTWNLSYEWYP